MTKKNLLIALKVVVSVGLVAFLIGGIDLGAEKDRIFSADPMMLLASAVVLLIQMGVAGGRWWVVMQAIDAPLKWIELSRLFWIGSFFSQALPSSIGGDPIRVYMAYKDGLLLGKAINGVMLERAVAVVGLIVLVAVVQPAFLPKLDQSMRVVTLTSLGMLTLGAVLGLALLMSLDRLPERLSRFRLVRGVSALAGDTRQLFLRIKFAVPALFFGMLTHVNIALCVYFLAMSLSVDVTWLDCMVLMPPVILVTTLPISIAGWGVREGAMAVAFGLVGVSQGGAVVLSLSLGLLSIVVMLPAGALWLLGRRKGETVSAAEAAEAVEEELSHRGEDSPSGA